jgi:catechol 2,3-dioxygenase-like lactoylglutathione lyase family enzyme
MTTNGEPRWRGINHLALVTPDMDTTTRFYHGVLGMRIVATLMAGPMRHYFFEIGPENTIAFFEVAGADTFDKQAGVPIREFPTQLDHISFNLADEEALHALQRRLKEAGCEVTDVIDHGIMHSVYFTDPNGIALEASWWLVDPTGRDADYGDPALWKDPDPVPAIRRLAAGEGLDSSPRTRLVGDRVVDPS